MHKIDIHNYEAYLLDFSEGNLTDELQVELELFLIQHPQLEINLEELSLMFVEEDSISFTNKNSLKKSESDLVSETQFIAYVENQLTEEEKIKLEKSCTLNPSLTKELKLYTHTIAKADTSIVFENKQSLKRKPKVIWFNFSAMQYAAAACVVFLIGVFMFWQKTQINSESLILANKIENVKAVVPSKKNELNTNFQNTTTIISPSQKTNTALAQQLPLAKKQQLLGTNNTTIASSNNTTLKDTLNKNINNSSVIEKQKNEPLIALNSTPIVKPSAKTIVQVITESDDEPITENTIKNKKGIWAKASRVLQNLNHAGVKSVNGDEETSKDKTAYAITLGGVSITHKAGL